MLRRSAAALGAPGVYFRPDAPPRTLSGVRMDVCCFAGVAPRGPARTPVLDEKCRPDKVYVEAGRKRRRTAAAAVHSFAEYRELFGGFEGPGLLPYAVAAFFEQGGRRAWIARIVHRYPDAASNAAGVAWGALPGARAPSGTVKLWARNEGSWGNRLRASLSWSARPLGMTDPTLTGFALPEDAAIPGGTLFRLRLADGSAVLRYAARVGRETLPLEARGRLRATFDAPAASLPRSAEVVEGALTVDDGEHSEIHERLGFAAGHPRWMAAVLFYESRLVWPDESYAETQIAPDSAALESKDAPAAGQFAGGLDRWSEIVPEDFFDAAWTPGDDEPGDGIHAFALLADAALLATPDLYSPAALAPVDRVAVPASLAGAEFAPCAQVPAGKQEEQPADLAGLRLDPRLPTERAAIVALQRRVVEFAETKRSAVALLDVPPWLSHRQVLEWREEFRSAWAAAYHPWLRAARGDDARDALVRIPPSAVAAGIVAAQEWRHGVQHGPANLLARGVVDVEDAVAPPRHDELHPRGINVFIRERDGVRLTGARTLSADPAWRQLSVRRFMTMLARSLEEQAQWIVFEPNNAFLRLEVRDFIGARLRRLFEEGALAGESEEEAYFVRVDGAGDADAGRLIVEIGVAPAEPAEFLVVRLIADSDGRVAVEE